jgi:hypothetical protein
MQVADGLAGSGFERAPWPLALARAPKAKTRKSLGTKKNAKLAQIYVVFPRFFPAAPLDCQVPGVLCASQLRPTSR